MTASVAVLMNGCGILSDVDFHATASEWVAAVQRKQKELRPEATSNDINSKLNRKLSTSNWLAEKVHFIIVEVLLHAEDMDGFSSFLFLEECVVDGSDFEREVSFSLCEVFDRTQPILCNKEKMKGC